MIIPLEVKILQFLFRFHKEYQLRLCGLFDPHPAVILSICPQTFPCFKFLELRQQWLVFQLIISSPNGKWSTKFIRSSSCLSLCV